MAIYDYVTLYLTSGAVIEGIVTDITEARVKVDDTWFQRDQVASWKVEG